MERLKIQNIEDEIRQENNALFLKDVYEEWKRYKATALTPEEIKNLVTINGNLVRANESLNHKLSSYRDAEEQGLLIRTSCIGCANNSLSECYDESCIRQVYHAKECYGFVVKDYYKPSGVLKGGEGE